MEKGKIFISYRQSDTQSEASRLKEDLEEVFGGKNVFFDIETLEPGLDFAEAIEKTLLQSKVVLVMIGPTWADVKDENGNLRLHNDNDWVRREVAMALAMKEVRVIPVLIKKATLPRADQLPDNIKALTDKHWKEITISRWRYDVGVLINSIEKIIPALKQSKPQPISQPIPLPRRQKSWWGKNYLWVIGIFALLLILMISSEDFQEGYQEGLNESAIDQPTQQLNEPQKSNTISVQGSWVLYLDNEPVSTLVLSQDSGQVEFIEYNALNINVGSGSGDLEVNEMYLDYYNSVVDLNGELYLSTYNDGNSWEGTIHFPSTGSDNTIALRRN